MKFFEYLKEVEDTTKAKVEYAKPGSFKHLVPLKGEVIDTEDSIEIKIASIQGTILIAHLLSKLPKTETLGEAEAKKVAAEVLKFTKKGDLKAGITLPKITKEVYTAATNFFFKDVMVASSTLASYIKEILVYGLNKKDPSKSVNQDQLIKYIKKAHELITFEAGGAGASEVSAEDEEKAKEFANEVKAKVDEHKLASKGKAFSGSLPGIKHVYGYYVRGAKLPKLVVTGSHDSKEYLLKMDATEDAVNNLLIDETRSAVAKAGVEGAEKSAQEQATKEYWKKLEEKFTGIWEQLNDEQKKKLKGLGIANKKDFIEVSKKQHVNKDFDTIKKEIASRTKELLAKQSSGSVDYKEFIDDISRTKGIDKDDQFQLDIVTKSTNINKYKIALELNPAATFNLRVMDIVVFAKGSNGLVEVDVSKPNIVSELRDMGASVKNISVLTVLVNTKTESKNTIEDIVVDKEITDTEKKEKSSKSFGAYNQALDALETEGKENPFISFDNGSVYIKSISNISLSLHNNVYGLAIFGKYNEIGNNNDKFFTTNIDLVTVKGAMPKTLAFNPKAIELLTLLFSNATEIVENLKKAIPALGALIASNPNKFNIVNLGSPIKNGDKTTSTVRPTLVSGGVKVSVKNLKSSRKIVQKANDGFGPRIISATSKVGGKEMDWSTAVKAKAIDNQSTERRDSKIVGFKNKFTGASYLIILGKAGSKED